MVVFDATMLVLAIRPEAGRPIDPGTRQPIEHVPERIAFLVEELEKSKTRIGIPTPALSEALVRAGEAANAFVNALSEMSVFQILPFDELSAIEVAIMTRHSLDSGDKRDGSTEVWNKIKYDRQIAGIARRYQAAAIYTDDRGLQNTAKRIGMPTVSLADLPRPPQKAQGEIDFTSSGAPENDQDEFPSDLDENTDDPE